MKITRSMVCASILLLASTGLYAQTYTATYSKKIVLAQNAGTSTTQKLTVQAPSLSSDWTLTLPTSAGTNTYFLQTDGNGNTSWASALINGVTSLVSVPSILTATGTTGDITIGLASQTMNTFLAAPNGSNGTPAFRAIVAGDLPNSGVAANTYGSATQVPQITVDTKGRITAVSNVTITGGGGGTITSIGTVAMTTGNGATPAVVIPDGVTLAIITDNSGSGDEKNITFPSGSNGQILYIMNLDANQKAKTGGGVHGSNIDDSGSGKSVALFIYYSGDWRRLD